MKHFESDRIKMFGLSQGWVMAKLGHGQVASIIALCS